MMPYTDYTVRLGDLKRAIVKNPYDPNLNIDGYMRYLKYNTPSARPDGKKGKWIKWEALNGLTCGSICSECGYITSAVPNYGTKFCPNCGADMRGKQDETNSRNKTY